MSEGLIVRPGDKLVIPVEGAAGPIHPEDVTKMQRSIQAEMPGVTVLLFQGMGGGAFVYRPAAPSGGPTGGTPND